jgi:hypothetical protein
MKRNALLLSAFLLASPVYAQATFTLPALTADQRWDRLEGHYTYLLATSVAFAKAQGKSIEEYARFIGKLAAPTWSKGLTPRGLIRGTYRNTMAWREADVVVTDSSEASPSARLNRSSYVRTFGTKGVVEGLTPDDWEQIFFFVSDEIAKYHGLVYEQRRDGDFLVITVRRR